MNNSVAAHIRTPTHDEITRMRQLWSDLKQPSAPAGTDIGVELRTYLTHAVRMVGLIAGLHDITGEPAKRGGPFPVRVTEDGVARIHDSVSLWSAILALWINAE
jgi:hypothetical protein